MQRTKNKQKPVAKPSLEYLKTFDPLTQSHAEAIVNTAGVDLDMALLNKMYQATDKFELGKLSTAAN